MARLENLQDAQGTCPSSKSLAPLHLCHTTMELLYPFLFCKSQLELHVKSNIHGREIGHVRQTVQSDLMAATISLFLRGYLWNTFDAEKELI